MAAVNQYGREERVKNILDHRKLSLSVPCPGDTSKNSTLMWMLVANNPRMVVWTNDPNDTGEANGYGKITANLDAAIFTMFLNMLGEIIEKEGEQKEYVTCMNYIFPGGKRSDRPVLVSTLYCGKDKEGMIWVSLVAKNRPIIKFVFGENEFHHFFNGDGTPADKAKVSQRYARAYIRLLYGLMEHLMVTNYVEPPKRDAGAAAAAAGGNSSYGNKSQGQRQNTNQQDDDIPF